LTTLPQLGLDKPINSGPQHHLVTKSALRHLDRWLRDGTAPPSGDRLQTTEGADGAPQLVADEHGIARGGIRTPWVDVPIARL
jgi:hypothetical protein